MNGVRFPDDFRLERLARAHLRKRFRCGEAAVDDWLAAQALQDKCGDRRPVTFCFALHEAKRRGPLSNLIQILSEQRYRAIPR